MRRIKTKALLAPATIYQHATIYADGYRPTETSRFGVVRVAKDGPWMLVHLRSGSRVGSLLPTLARKYTVTELLFVAAAFETATHLDWSPFDNLPEAQEGAAKAAGFRDADRPAAMRTAAELRSIASKAVFP